MLKFTDHRFCIAVLLVWLVVLLTCFVEFGGLEENSLVHIGFGPSDVLKFLGFRINSWSKWSVVVGFAALDTSINTWGIEIIWPWIQNNVYNFMHTQLTYTRPTTMAITNLFYTYQNIRNVFVVYLAFTQIDILLFRIAFDLFVTLATSWTYIRVKTVMPAHTYSQIATDVTNDVVLEIV